ncbi:MAG: hypothetical protein JWP44_4939 [Mucilaginibacter sp.]|nr:hypothetical protein [Mucilaginibacter sp.]
MSTPSEITKSASANLATILYNQLNYAWKRGDAVSNELTILRTDIEKALTGTIGKVGQSDQTLVSGVILMRSIIRELYNDLPQKRDWLNPTLEAEMLAIIKNTW